MKRLLAFLVGLTAVFLLGGCSSQGKPADPPPSVQAEARENGVVVTFPMADGVEYWIFYAPSNSLTSTNFTTVSGGRLLPGAVSPQLIAGLTNGTTYYFTINGRTHGGPGGPGTPLVSATPRLAGSDWAAGVPIAPTDIRSVAYGTQFVAVGAGGKMFSSSDGIAWTAQSFVASGELSRIRYGAGIYVALGAGALILTSSDTATWNVQTTDTTSDLHDLTTDSIGTYVAVGANGVIVVSSGGGSWSRASSGTGSNLYSVMYAGGRYVAVGAGGIAVTSTDAVNWTSVPSQSTRDLRSITYDFALGRFVAVGAAGTVVTSTDGLTWTLQAPLSAKDLNEVLVGSQVVAVGADGVIFISADGLSWQAAASGTSSTLNAVAYGNSGYVAVGAAGASLRSY